MQFYDFLQNDEEKKSHNLLVNEIQLWDVICEFKVWYTSYICLICAMLYFGALYPHTVKPLI